MAQMTVQVVTPDGLKYDHHASFIHAVTKDGQIGILPGHINLIAPLEVDELKVRRVDRRESRRLDCRKRWYHRS